MAADHLRLQDLNALLANLKTKADTEHSSLIISIDLGTTFSGYVKSFQGFGRCWGGMVIFANAASVGYLFTANPETVHILEQWPGQTSVKVPSPKVPTVLKYGSGGPGFTWGYQVGLRDEKRVEAFKLLLDANLPRPEYTDIMKVERNFREFNKTAVSAVNDFMGALYRYAIAAIEEKHNVAYSEILAVKFIVSTPTGWPESAKSAILKAAKDAVGSPQKSPVQHISEAEAAAYFAMKSKEAKSVALKAGDTIMVCDAGGATAHLTSFSIRSMNPLKVVEFVPPLTRTAGSMNISKNFEQHIKRNLLEDEEFIALKRSPLYVETLKHFDQHIKPLFTSSNKKPFNVQLQGAKLTDYPDGKLKNNTMIFDTRALDVMFLPIINSIATCITEQINAVKVKKVGNKSDDRSSVDAIIMVGGLGANNYLLDCLGKRFTTIKFIQPTNAWTAVIRGAALHYAPLPQRVETFGSSSSFQAMTTKASKHYGIACSPIFDDTIHEHGQKYWDSWEGVWRCKTINWLIKKGDDLRKPRKFSIPYYKQCGPHPEGDDFFVSVNLEQSTAVNPPQPSTQSSITTNKSIRIPLDSISDDLFQKKTRSSDGELYWQLVYEIVLDVSNGRIAFWIEINGKQFYRVAIN